MVLYFWHLSCNIISKRPQAGQAGWLLVFVSPLHKIWNLKQMTPERSECFCLVMEQTGSLLQTDKGR